VAATAHPDTELGKAIEGCGLLSPPGDAIAFAAAIRSLARDPAQRAAFGLAGRCYAESCLGMEPILQRFAADLQLLTGAEMVAVVDMAKVEDIADVVKKRA
jgi:colanic acid biosynthesis glycosyl transferase WcaI